MTTSPCPVSSKRFLPGPQIAKGLISFLLVCLVVPGLYAQKVCSSLILSSRDSGTEKHFSWSDASGNNKLRLRPFVIPAVGIAYGVVALHNHQLLSLNNEMKEELYTESPHAAFHLDNYLQFAPGSTVFLLSSIGVKGKHGLVDQAGVYLLSNLFLISTVTVVKGISHEQRPDGSSYSSFPSGHTAEAFAGAQLLFHEYKDVSLWYGIGGYLSAAATGYLRMYNNKHWFNDVVAGAGVGIASTEFAYFVYPLIKRVFYKGRSVRTLVMPNYQNRILAINLSRSF